MKQGSLYETFIQLAALVFAFIVVQATYTTVIRPVAANKETVPFSTVISSTAIQTVTYGS